MSELKQVVVWDSEFYNLPSEWTHVENTYGCQPNKRTCKCPTVYNQCSSLPALRDRLLQDHNIELQGVIYR